MINGVFNDGLIRKFTPNRRSSHVFKDPHETLLVSDVKLPLSIQGTIAQHRLQLSVSQLSVWNLVLIFYSAAFGDFSEFSFHRLVQDESFNFARRNARCTRTPCPFLKTF